MAHQRVSSASRPLRLLLLAITLLTGLVVAAVFALPFLLEQAAVNLFRKQEWENPQVKVRSVDTHSVDIEKIHLEAPAYTIDVGAVRAAYDLWDLVRWRTIERVQIDELRAELLLDQITLPESDGRPPILLPAILEQLPVQQLILKNGHLSLVSGEAKESLTVIGRFEHSGASISLSASAQQLDKDDTAPRSSLQLDLTGHDGEGTANLSFSLIDPIEWLDLLDPFVELPESFDLTVGLLSGQLRAFITERFIRNWTTVATATSISFPGSISEDSLIEIAELSFDVSGQFPAGETDSPTPLKGVLRLESGTAAGVGFRDATLAAQFPEPGVLELQQAEVSIGDGSLQVSPGKITFKNRLLGIPEPMELLLENINLADIPISQLMPGAIVDGIASVAISVQQTEPSSSLHDLAGEITFHSSNFFVALRPLSLSATLENIELRGTGFSSIDIETATPIRIPRISFANYALEGNVVLGFLGSLLNFPAALLGATPEVEFHGEIALNDAELLGRVECYGIGGTIGIAVASSQYALRAAPVGIEQISIGEVLLEGAKASINIENGAFTEFALSASFLGGKVSVEEVTGDINNVRFTLTLQDVDAAQLSALLPRFEGKIAGPLNGYLKLRYDGGIHIIAGELALREGVNGRFAYPDASELFEKQQDERMMRYLQTSLEDLILKQFVLRLDPTDAAEPPIRILIAGTGAKRGSVPVEIDLKIQGDITDVLELILGNKFTISFN